MVDHRRDGGGSGGGRQHRLWPWAMGRATRRRAHRRLGWRHGPGGKAEKLAERWGGLGIFFSRWLVSPIGPAINLTSGIAAYSWLKFLMLDVAGELVWVMLYVTLGRMFSDRVEAVSDLLGNLTWVILGGCAVVFLLWKLINIFRLGNADVSTVAVTNDGHESSSELAAGCLQGS